MSEPITPRQVPPHTPGWRYEIQVDAFSTREYLIERGLTPEAADEALAVYAALVTTRHEARDVR